MTLKAVFFDAAGTLIKTTRPVGDNYALTAKQYGMEVSAQEVGERFRACFSSAPPLAFPGAPVERIPDLERQWWKDLVQRIFEPYGRFARFDEYFSDLFLYFSRAAAWSLYPEAPEALAALKERGLTLAVVSNFDSRLPPILEGLGIASLFDSVILSSRVGYAKPAPEIFHEALNRYRLKGDEALHVGDSRQKDVAGAKAAGLSAILLDRHDRAASDSVPRVRNLTEIFSFIFSKV